MRLRRLDRGDAFHTLPIGLGDTLEGLQGQTGELLESHHGRSTLDPVPSQILGSVELLVRAIERLFHGARRGRIV